MRQASKHPSDAGFTMVEILVTLIILSIGLLGLAGLQANSMTNNHNAYLKSQAMLLANDMGDRMRANMVGVGAGNYNSISGLPADPGCISAGCTPGLMATSDTFEWNTALQDQLPAGTGTVDGDGTTFTITIRWDEARNGASGTGCNPLIDTDLKCLILSLTP